MVGEANSGTPDEPRLIGAYMVLEGPPRTVHCTIMLSTLPLSPPNWSMTWFVCARSLSIIQAGT